MLSVKKPITGGIIAPPKIIVHKIPEACGRKSDNPSEAKVKMVGNIIELNKPTAKILHIESNPSVFIEIRISRIAINENAINTFDGAIFWVRYAPMKRPIMAPPQ